MIMGKADGPSGSQNGNRSSNPLRARVRCRSWYVPEDWLSVPLQAIARDCQMRLQGFSGCLAHLAS